MLPCLLALGALLLGPQSRGANPPPPPLAVEGFDSPDAVREWRVFGGLTSGDGPPSTVAVEEGALRLAGDESTGRWRVVSRTFPLGDVRWLRVAARMRSRAVDGAHSKFQNAGPWLRFDEDEVTSLPPMLGTSEWTWLARRYTVPRRAKTVTVGFYLTLPGALEIDELRLETTPDWLEARDGPFLFRWLPGDEPRPEERKELRAAFDRSCEFLDVRPEYAIVYLKYPDAAVKEEYMGSRRAANLEGTIVHTTHRVDRHEMVHLLAKPWGAPIPLLAEGLACWLDGTVEGRPWTERARELAADGWIPLGSLVERPAFLDAPDEVAHTIAAAFVDWVLAERDKELLRALYGSLGETYLASRNALELEQRLGLTLSELDAALRARVTREE